MNRLSTFQVTAQVSDDGNLGVKVPTDLKPGTYDGVLVLQRVEAKPAEEAPESFVPLPSM